MAAPIYLRTSRLWDRTQVRRLGLEARSLLRGNLFVSFGVVLNMKRLSAIPLPLACALVVRHPCRRGATQRLRWPDSRESIRRLESIRANRLILANRFRVPELSPFFCESRFGGLKIANRRFEAIRSNRSHVMKLGIRVFSANRFARFALRIAGPSKLLSQRCLWQLVQYHMKTMQKLLFLGRKPHNAPKAPVH